ncbi:conjugal transfer protein TraF, partial [Cysteiniphilum sp. SYW-8]
MINQIVVAASYNATGWQWYSKANEKNDEKEEDEIVEQNLQQTQTIQPPNAAKLLKNQNQKKQQKQQKQESYSAQLKAFQAHYEEMQAKAVLTRKVEDVAYVMYLRMFMMEQAKDYGRSFEKALLHYPNLSYALKFPTQDRAREITRERQHKRQQ